LVKVIPNQRFQYPIIPGICVEFRFLERKNGVNVKAELRKGANEKSQLSRKSCMSLAFGPTELNR